jgi:integrase
MRKQRGTAGKRDGFWYIYYRMPSGKQKYQRGFSSQSDALKRLNEILSELYSGEYIEEKKTTFAEFAEDYVQKRLSIRGSTSASYASMIRRHFIPFFGKINVNEIQLQTIQSFIREYEGQVSNKTLHNLVTLLKVMLVSGKGSSAIKQGYLRHDPTLGLELPRLEIRTIVPPTQEQVWKLINVASFFGRNLDVMVYLGAFAGIRRGELLALMNTDIDWDKKEIVINKALTRFPAKNETHLWRWKVGPTKSKRSVRRAVISDMVVEYLTRIKEIANKSVSNPMGLLFPGDNGKPMDPDYFDTLFAEVRTKAGLSSLRYHDLRHFFASLLISQGFSSKYVCDQLGHSSIQVTFDTYGHLFPKAREEASDRLQKVIREGRQKAIASGMLAEDDGIDASEGSKKYVN